jgi:uncharacterized protein YcaQ
MSRAELTLEQARRAAVRAQGLDGSEQTVLDVVRRLGFLQMDPIATIATPQQLVLFNRIGRFDPSELDRLMWEERKLFEWNAFIWPIEDLPLVRARTSIPGHGTSLRRRRDFAATSCASSSRTGRCSRETSRQTCSRRVSLTGGGAPVT